MKITEGLREILNKTRRKNETESCERLKEMPTVYSVDGELVHLAGDMDIKCNWELKDDYMKISIFMGE